ncbi:MAG TPA: response regulator [Phycisphaerae bacterium]|nr:response regulator [Phycisphaerae bacterium]
MIAEGYHILLIDDDPDIHHAVRAMLPEPEFHVTCCATGPTGLEAMRQSPPDLVLLDIMLATPSEGFHLCYVMKEEPRLRDVPVIMISAIGERVGMDYAKELGTDYVPAEAFLEKPLDAATLQRAVRRFLRVRT